MEKTFEYFKELKANDSLSVYDIGNCCLKAFNDDGQVYYLMTTTTLGFTKVYQYGPLNVDDLNLGVYYNCSVQTIEYSEKVLFKLIDSFLNDKYKKITQAFECQIDEFIKNCKSII